MNTYTEYWEALGVAGPKMLEEILNELEQAKKTIYECYDKLRTMEFLTVEKAASGN